MNQSVSIPKFDGKDISVWKAQMEALLVAKGLGDVILHSRPRNTTDEAKVPQVTLDQKSYDEKDRQAKSMLLLGLDSKHCKLVLQCTGSKEIWKRLSALHELRSSASKMVLQKEFFE